MSCDAAQFEMLSNQTKVQALYSEIDRAQDDRTRNMFFGGLIGYATSEDGSAARAEIGTLQSRNTNLMMMMQRNGCWSPGGRATTPPPATVVALAPVQPPIASPHDLMTCRERETLLTRTRAECVANAGAVI